MVSGVAMLKYCGWTGVMLELLLAYALGRAANWDSGALVWLIITTLGPNSGAIGGVFIGRPV